MAARRAKRPLAEDLHFHDLRGEHGSALLEAGASVHEVRDALGHSSITMTNTYLRSRTNSLDDAYAKLEAARAGKVVPITDYHKRSTRTRRRSA